MDRVKKFTGLLGRSKSQSVRSNRNSIVDHLNDANADSPEANAPRAIRLFCESGSTSNGGEEVLHLPVIVESAESSPSAAASAAQQIRIFLGKDFQSKPHVQYNAIMLIRILSDNPGATFTRNFDKSFVTTTKELLRTGKDQSTQQILRETLDFLEAEKGYDEGVQPLLQMWRKEKGQQASLARDGRPSQYQQPRGPFLTQPGIQQSNGQRGGRNQLPPPVELASRVEEAKNTAKILLQLVQSTPSEDFLNNELIREFGERCQSASRSMQTYINCDNPAPDHDTMQTLIETNEQLSLALSKHQRAVLAARRALGVSPSPNNAEAPQENGHHAFAPAPAQQQSSPQQQQYVYSQQPTAPTNGYGQQLASPYNTQQGFEAPPGAPPQRQPEPEPISNPFADPEPTTTSSHFPTETTSYGAFSAPPNHHQTQPRHLPHPSQSFSIEPEVLPPQIPPISRQDTSDLEDIYSTSPVSSRAAAAAPPSRVSPPSTAQSLERPGPGPWHTSDVTQSYVGRQASAADGLTMHGGGGGDGGEERVPEIDGHSEVGRTGGFDRGSVVSQPSTAVSGSGASGYEVSPVETRQQQQQQHQPQQRRVDVPGTGGLRNV